MELLVSVFIYILVFGFAALLAFVPAVIAYFASRKRMGRGWSYFAGLVVILSILAGLSQKPMLFYSRDCIQSLSAEQEESVRSISGGTYSIRAPMISAVIIVEKVREDYAAWTEYYFPIGNRSIELSGEDGFNCTKYLFPW